MRSCLVPELEDEAMPHLLTRERGVASYLHGKTRRCLILKLEDKATPCLPAGERGAGLVFQQENEALPRPRAER
ncbi:hypothetical protein GW17_00041651 [Ensete ventricosum]|nr:hypothetical protein GW17_00041651 [Ensete ventricosum]